MELRIAAARAAQPMAAFADGEPSTPTMIAASVYTIIFHVAQSCPRMAVSH